MYSRERQWQSGEKNGAAKATSGTVGCRYMLQWNSSAELREAKAK